MAQPFAIFALGGNVAHVGFAATVTVLPTVLFLLFGGVIADRLPRHQVLACAHVAEGVTQAVAAVLVLTGAGHPWHLVALAAVRGTAGGFTVPAEQGLLPQTVDADQLSKANATVRLGRNTSQVIGSAVGGLLVGLLGPGWALLLDAATFGVAALCRAWMRIAPDVDRIPGTSLVHELREGWHEFVGRQWLWVVVLQSAIVVAVHLGGMNVVGPLVAKEDLGGATPWGFVLAALSLGMVIGALVMLRWQPRRMLLAATVSVFFEIPPLLGLAVPLSVPVLCVATFATGVSMGVFGVCWSTTMMQEIPSRLLSRVSAYDAFGSFAFAPIGGAVAGPVAVHVGVRPRW